MACGEFGPGRMAEPDDIVEAIENLLADAPAKRGGATSKSLSGRHVLITSGPTQEPIDPVRYIANRSSGKQGHALARAAQALGATVTLVSGPVTLPDPEGVRVVKVETANEMLAAVQQALPADIAICAAAVADWRAADEAPHKLKKSGQATEAELKLTLNPDILATISKPGPKRPRLVVGFAAETENLIENAKAKLRTKGADWIVANDVWPGTGAMGGDKTQVHIVTGGGVENWPPMTKDEMAQRLLAQIAAALARDALGGGMSKDGAEVTLRVRRLPHGEGLELPTYQSAHAAGLDLVAGVPADAPMILPPGARGLVPTGLSIELPPGYEAQVRPRSGLALKHGVTLLNSPGTIDADYRGEVMVLLVNHGAEPFTVRRGDRIAQLIVASVEHVAIVEVAELGNTTRGAGGFGSTG